MKGLIQTLLRAIGILTPQLGTMANTSLPSLSEDHPASIQFSAWLTAFNTGDKDVLAAYHSDSVFPYSVASKDIKALDREYGLAQASGGFDVVDIESSSSPSVLKVVMKERKRPIYARVCITVDISKKAYPVTEFKINPVPKPPKLISEDDPRRLVYEKALRPLDGSLRRKVVDAFAKALKEEYIDPENGRKLADIINSHFERGQYDSIEDSAELAHRLTQDLHDTDCGKYRLFPPSFATLAQRQLGFAVLTF
jgi:N-terminal domain of Peptidase_S41 in eukaryotic IRBP